MNPKTKKALAATVAGLVLLGGGAGIGHILAPTTHEVVVTKEVPGPVETITIPGPTEIQTVIKNVTIEVPVDNGKLSGLEKFLWDHSGDAHALMVDLKESEQAQIADRVVFLNDAQALAEEAVRAQAAHELHRETVAINETSSILLRESNIERIRVQDDPTDITLSGMDFDRADVDVLVPITFEQDDVKLKADILVLVRDGVVDDVILDSVSVR